MADDEIEVRGSRRPWWLLRKAMALAAFAAAGFTISPQTIAAQTGPMERDNPMVIAPTDAYDYVTREVMIPMRDGKKLRTVIVLPKGAVHAPILLTRTPYGTRRFASRMSPDVTAAVGRVFAEFIHDGYIVISQDIRGINGSEGDWVMTRPPVGPLNHTGIDESTDAYDTIDWLVKHVPETNGRVGMIGSSYTGFTAAMALINPHPALKAVVPQCPMINGWKGDDFFRNGAFRVGPTADYAYSMAVGGGPEPIIPRDGYDDYENFRLAGSSSDFGRKGNLAAIPFWRRLEEHQAYDAFWQGQAIDRLLANAPLKVPTMWVGSLWDQEDIYGAVHAYAATEPKDVDNRLNFLVLGPWRHSGAFAEGRSLGPLQWPGDTAEEFRRTVMKPFLDQYLKDGAPKADTPPVFAFQSGANHWQRLSRWPVACEECTLRLTPLFLSDRHTLTDHKPVAAQGFDSYIADPASPVPYLPRPIRHDDQMNAWDQWLVADQRFVDGRTDVLSYQTAPLSAAVTISGRAIANLFASTSGTDSDWVVKLIDVYPPTMALQPEMGGYQLGIAMSIFRGRYVDSFEHPRALRPGQPEHYRFILPDANHVFLPGHRIMVQIQSSWFPAYDRNPQTYVSNIFDAKPGDYQKAEQHVFRSATHASSIELPILPVDQH